MWVLQRGTHSLSAEKRSKIFSSALLAQQCLTLLTLSPNAVFCTANCAFLTRNELQENQNVSQLVSWGDHSVKCAVFGTHARTYSRPPLNSILFLSVIPWKYSGYWLEIRTVQNVFGVLLGFRNQPIYYMVAVSALMHTLVTQRHYTSHADARTHTHTQGYSRE